MGLGRRVKEPEKWLDKDVSWSGQLGSSKRSNLCFYCSQQIEPGFKYLNMIKINVQ